MSPDAINKYLSMIVNESLQKLKESGCIEYDADDGALRSTPLGFLSSFYYLSNETAKYLHMSLTSGLKID